MPNRKQGQTTFFAAALLASLSMMPAGVWAQAKPWHYKEFLEAVEQALGAVA